MAAHTVEISTGERPHKITLENPGGQVPDGDGGYIEGWVLLAEVRGKLAPASKSDLEKVIAGTVTAVMPYLAVVPYVAGVTTRSRILYHGREFAILGWRNVDERNIRLEIVCEERSSGSASTSSSSSGQAAEAGAA
jgi:SPP1 family predicted phage head-tail adaptor